MMRLNFLLGNKCRSENAMALDKLLLPRKAGSYPE
jgi:hypothetical protein